MKAKKPIMVLFVAAALLSVALVPALGQTGPSAAPALQVGQTAIVRVYYPDDAARISIFLSFEPQILETDYQARYHVMQVQQAEIDRLAALGLRVEVDSGWAAPPVTGPLPLGVETIPGYSCYRTVEETYAAAEALVINHSALASWVDVGDSWEKSASVGGYDMRVLRLTNSAITGDKPDLFITGSIHAREYTPAETATRFGEYLVNNYGSDPDATWILDHHEVHLMLQANPDGRKKAETGLSWRKNTNQDYCGPTSNSRGADLNRNFQFKWGCCGGSSGVECDATYRGPTAASEPEIQAVQAYMASIFLDQRGPGDTDAAPSDATGLYIDLHSYSELVMWPWGWTSTNSPNATQLQTLGRKMAYFNSYTPQKSYSLYATDGTTDDHAYGIFGVASYCIEMGTAFFQSCTTFENTIYPNNLQALLYAAKVVRTPYMTPLGPDALSLALSGSQVPAGTAVTLSGSINDTRYRSGYGEPTQNIAAAEYYVDIPPWGTGATAHAMAASDGSFSSTVEAVTATVDTTGWSMGKHLLFVRGEDASGNWGAFTGIFLTITDGSTPTPTSTPTDTPIPTATPTPTNTPTPAPVQPILLVDDDNNSSYQSYFTAALSSLGRGYDTWTVYSQGSPSTATLQAHQVVIWFTGSDYSTTLTTTDITNLTAYLNGGGKLFITGQDIGYDINTNAFYSSYLHASYVADDTNVTTLTGSDIMAGADITITGGDGASNQTYPSAIGLGSGAAGLYDYAGTAYTWGALRWEGAYRVVYFAFGFEGISAAATRATVMGNVLAWLEGGVAPTATPTNTAVPPTNTPTSTPTNTPPPGPTNTPAPTPTPTNTPPPSGETIWLSLTANASLGSLGTVSDEDIVALDPATGVYSWVFDGSDVGITTDIDAFDVLDNGHILMSFDNTTSVTGVGTVYDPDIVEFTPTSLGSTTAGTFTWKFDGSDVGLSTTYEDIDALFFLVDGTMVVSIRDAFSVTGISGQDEDLVRFVATSWGSTTAGTWSWYFDGSDVGLSTTSNEDVDGIWLDTAIAPNPYVYLSTLGTFSVTGVSGENEDIFVFKPTALGSTTSGTFNTTLYLDGSAFSLSSYDIDAFDVQR